MGIGRRIKEAREARGLTQKELGALIDVTASAITNYENETSHPKEPVMYKLLDALRVDANYLFQDVVHVKSEFQADFKEQEHIKKYRALDDYGQKAIDGLLEIEYTRCTTPQPVPLPEAVEEEQEPLYNVVSFPLPDNRASAGFGDELDSDDVTTITAIANRDTIRADFCVKVDGHSMEPLYRDGDLVLVHRQPAIDVGSIGVFAANDKGYIKQQGEDRLISLNPAYPDVEPEECYVYKCFGEVIGVLDPEWIVE